LALNWKCSEGGFRFFGSISWNKSDTFSFHTPPTNKAFYSLNTRYARARNTDGHMARLLAVNIRWKRNHGIFQIQSTYVP
jgi:hypothetical protein